MLSILIPVYNFNVYPLLKSLEEQISKLNPLIEIIVIDDASEVNYQLDQSKLGKRTRYTILENNLGRSKIRNLLSSYAKYDYLLFLDCDSQPVNNDFIATYIINCKPNKIVCGGTKYKKEAPVDSSYFRWYYGHKKESISLDIRKRNGFNSFMSNNFLIPKADFNTLKFDESLIEYGHEDTLFGIMAKQADVEIIAIDNPVYHIGLETSDVFLEKTKKSIDNLVLLLKSKPVIARELKESVSLLRFYFQLKKYGLLWIVPILYKLMAFGIDKKIKPKKIRLYQFNLFKLNYLKKSFY